MSHLASTFLSPQNLRSKNRLVVVRSVSDAAILATAFVAGIFLCANAGLANAFMFKLGGAASNILVRFNQILMLAVIFLLWKLLRWGRERNELLRERNKIVVQLNHTIRNACQAILLFAHLDKSADPETVRASVVRIERALDEYIPNSFVVVAPREKTG